MLLLPDISMPESSTPNETIQNIPLGTVVTVSSRNFHEARLLSDDKTVIIGVSDRRPHFYGSYLIVVETPDWRAGHKNRTMCRCLQLCQARVNASGAMQYIPLRKYYIPEGNFDYHIVEASPPEDPSS